MICTLFKCEFCKKYLSKKAFYLLSIALIKKITSRFVKFGEFYWFHRTENLQSVQLRKLDYNFSAFFIEPIEGVGCLNWYLISRFDIKRERRMWR